MIRWSSLASLLIVLVAACDQAGGGGTDDPFAAAIPDADMLALAFDDTEGLSSALGADAEVAPVPGGYRQLAQAVMIRLNLLMSTTGAAVATLTGAVEPVEVTQGATTCKTWEGNAEAVHWTLLACLKDKGALKYGFALKGRAVGTDAADDLVVLAGEGKAMPAWNGKKRGVGRVGFNFDHLGTLTGTSIGGRLGIAYRSVGIVRALNLGLDQVVATEGDQPRSGVYRFRLLIGKGGRFAYLDTGDYLAVEGGQLVEGQDFVDEHVRVAAGWRTDGWARTVRAACGGSVGEGQCVRVAACWDAGASLTWQALLDPGQEIAWEPAECQDVPLEILGEPSDDDVALPQGTDDESAAPVLPEPEILPEEGE